MHKTFTSKLPHSMNKPSSGRSMIEMLGVLAIIGVLSAGGVWGYTLAMENYRINKFIEDMQTMASATAPYFSNPNRSSRLSLEDLHTLGIVPDSYYKTRKGICNVRTAPASCSVQSPTTDIIKLYTYPTRFTAYITSTMSQKLCVKLYTHDWGKYGKQKVTIYSFGPEHEEALPISNSKAEALCKNQKATNTHLLLKFNY